MLYLQPKNNHEKHLIQVLLALMNDLPVEIDKGKFRPYEEKMLHLYYNYRVSINFLTQEIWDLIDKKFQFLAINSMGEIFFFVEKPTLNLNYNCWTSTGEVKKCDIIDASIFKDKWQFSLCDRKGNTYIEPQNKHQKFMVQVLLAKKHNITVFKKQKDNYNFLIFKEFESDYDFEIIDLTREYQIHEVTNNIDMDEAWNYINKVYNFIAKDKDGSVHLFQHKPHICRDCWVNDNKHKNSHKIFVNDVLDIDTSDILWNESLSARLGY